MTEESLLRSTPPRSTAGTGRAVLVTVLVGLVLTIVFASREESRAVRERELQFGREAEAAQQTVSARIDELSAQFETAVAFVGSTHPTAPDIHDEFFERTYPERADEGLSMLLLEAVDRDDLDALVAREVRFGSADFEVIESPVLTDEPALVVTRVNGSPGFDSLRGYDISFARHLVFPGNLPPGGFSLQAAEATGLMAATSTTSLSDAAEIPEITIYFVGDVIDRDGERIGWAVRFLTTSEFVGDLTIPEHLCLQLAVSNVDEPLAQLPYQVDDAAIDPDLRDVHFFEAAEETWSVEVMAHPDFGGRTGLLAQTRVLVFGSLATVIAAITAGAWEHYRHRLAGTSSELARARTLATTDPLTGLLNRQGLIDGARELLPRTAATLYFIDLDGFKKINDERGHEAGDAVLTEVATALRSSFRRSDLVARLGGDEFVVFAADGRQPSVDSRLASRVVAEVSAIDLHLSCSMGLAHRAAGETTDIKDLLRAADKAMYLAKRAGGDRFVAAERVAV